MTILDIQRHIWMTGRQHQLPGRPPESLGPHQMPRSDSAFRQTTHNEAGSVTSPVPLHADASMLMQRLQCLSPSESFCNDHDQHYIPYDLRPNHPTPPTPFAIDLTALTQQQHDDHGFHPCIVRPGSEPIHIEVVGSPAAPNSMKSPSFQQDRRSPQTEGLRHSSSTSSLAALSTRASADNVLAVLGLNRRHRAPSSFPDLTKTFS